MPSTYAHYRFGQDCMNLLPDKLRRICREYEHIYNIGVHGPDIFFYHHPLGKKDTVNSFGSELHHRSGKEFFESVKTPFREDKEMCDAKLAFLMGFLAHYTFDSTAHGYINKLARKGPFSHNYIESEYEAFRMRMAGRNPLKVRRYALVDPTKDAAKAIACFFPFSKRTIFKTLKGQRFILRVLYSPTGIWKKIATIGVHRIPFLSDRYADLFLSDEEDPGCRRSNSIIWDLENDALDLYPVLAKNFIRFIAGKEDLCDRFDYDFEGKLQ